MLDKFVDSPNRKTQVHDDRFLLKEMNPHGRGIYRVYFRERGVMQITFESEKLENAVRHILQAYSFLK